MIEPRLAAHGLAIDVAIEREARVTDVVHRSAIRDRDIRKMKSRMHGREPE